LAIQYRRALLVRLPLTLANPMNQLQSSA